MSSFVLDKIDPGAPILLILERSVLPLKYLLMTSWLYLIFAPCSMDITNFIKTGNTTEIDRQNYTTNKR
jgi:hypothetical protein